MRRIAAAAGAALLLVVLAGSAACAPDAAEPDGTSSPRTTDYRPGMPATVQLPQGPARAAVVLVPGGSWSTAEPAGIARLADAVLAADLAVVTVTYGTSGSGALYPVPADDVACAVSFAAAQVPDVPVVVVGHSAGGHLALLAALAPEPRVPGACPHPTHPADGVVGLAGPYDVAATGMAENLFGVPRSEAPQVWTEGNPLTWAAERPDLPVLLLHGDDDAVVPVRFTDGAAEALRAGGHPVQVEVLPGVDHMEVIRPDVIGDLLTGWVTGTVLAAP